MSRQETTLREVREMDVESRIRAFNRKREALLDELAGLDPALLTARPFPGKWSILENVEHLVRAEESVFRGLPEPAQLRHKNRTWLHRILYRFVMFLLRSRVRLKVPSKAMRPRGEGSLESWRQRWDRSQDWLAAYVGGLTQEGLRQAVFIHPVAGPLDLGQVADLAEVHLETHLRQIRALQRELGVAQKTL